MSYANHTTVIGRLTADPEVYQTRSGRPKVTFRLACPRQVSAGTQSADYFTVVCLGERFVPLLEALAKGKRVTVVGRLTSRDIPGGRTVTEIRADTVLPIAELPPGREVGHDDVSA